MKKQKPWLLRINPKIVSRWVIPGLVLAAAILWSAVAVSPGQTLDVYFLDVGQGDAIYGRLPTGEDFLVDGGPENNVLDELGQVMPFYDHEINLVIATHNHADHISGLIDVLSKYQVNEIWISGSLHTTQTFLNFLAAVKNEQAAGAAVKVIKAGHERELGQAHFKVLFPMESYEGKTPEEQHNATLVTRLSYGKIDYLLTGDLNENHEKQILDSGALIESEVLKIPHHGSASGLLEEFLDAVKPKYAIIQVGADNKFHHPTMSVISKLSDRNIAAYRNDEDGRVMISTDGENIFVR